MAIFFTYMFFACGLCVQVFTAYGINYAHIFELTHENRVTHVELYKLASIFMFMTCLGINIFWDNAFYTYIQLENGNTDKHGSNIHIGLKWFGLTFFAFLILFWINPLNMLYRHARFDTARVVLNILISPFGLVNFKYFFLADVITSMGVTIKDITSVIIGISVWNI